MFWTNLMVAIIEFVVMASMTGVFIYYIYRIFVHANPDFDMEHEIKKNNVAVGILMFSIMISGSTILYRGLDSIMDMVRLHASAPGQTGMNWWQLAGLGLAHITVALLMSVYTISITLRLFGRMTRGMKEGQELQRGNIAVGLLLSAVVIISALFVGSGVSAVSRALVPQLNVASVEIMQ